MKWSISKEKWFELTFALKFLSNTLIHCLRRYGEMLCLSCQWEVLLNTCFLQENLVLQKEVIRQNVSRIWLFLITHGHLSGPGHHHLWSAFLQKLPDGPLCFILILQSILKKQLRSYHTSCPTLQWLPISSGKSLTTAPYGLSSHILSQVRHTSPLASLRFAGFTPARFPPGLFLNLPGMLLPLGLCACCSLILESLYPLCPASTLPSPNSSFSQKPPSPWGFLCPSI